MFAACMPPSPARAQAPGEDSTDSAPPDLPVYDQPPMPAGGYVWTPGYWAWSDDDQDFYWVPGTWVLAPQPDFLWTPGYWEIADVVFFWHPGYWGRHVGFYGGINYGFGYRGDASGGRQSYLGGNGIQARPGAAQLAAANERHIEATPAQRQQIQAAARTRRPPFLSKSGTAARRSHAPTRGLERAGRDRHEIAGNLQRGARIRSRTAGLPAGLGRIAGSGARRRRAQREQPTAGALRFAASRATPGPSAPAGCPRPARRGAAPPCRAGGTSGARVPRASPPRAADHAPERTPEH